MFQCRQCASFQQRERRRRQRERHDQRTIRKFVSQVKAEANAQRIAVLLHVAEQQLGGPEQFAAAWNRHLDAARQLPDGHRGTLDALNTVIRLNIAASALKPARSFDDLSDDELAEQTQQLLTQKLVENLEAILEHLEREGWTIMPPEEFAEVSSAENPSRRGAA